MSTVYNPLASGEALLNSFSTSLSPSPVPDNGISPESVASSLNIAPGVGSIVNLGNNVAGAVAGGAVGLGGLSISRIVALLLGLLLIGGGIIMFRPEIATEAVKAAAA